MSKLPARTCGRPGCNGIIRDDVCSRCGPVKRTGWKDDTQRGTRSERGYDNDWLRLRKVFIEQKTYEAAMGGESAYPICELCGEPVRTSLHVDHIVPHAGIGDPLRLDMNNLRITHMRCHMQHTAHHSHDSPGREGRIGAT